MAYYYLFGVSLDFLQYNDYFERCQNNSEFSDCAPLNPFNTKYFKLTQSVKNDYSRCK